jgi:hypothetical protein
MLNADASRMNLRDAYLFAAPIVCDQESVDGEFFFHQIRHMKSHFYILYFLS